MIVHDRPKPAAATMEIDPFIKNMPKVELHIHIEGTLSPKLRWELSKKNNVPIPYQNFEELKASYIPMSQLNKDMDGKTGLQTFLDAYYGGMTVLQMDSDFYDLAMECFERLATMNVKYVEPFFDPQAHTRRGVPIAAVMEGLQRAREDAKTRYGLICNWTMCFLRDMSVDSAEETYEACAPYRGKVFQAVGLDSNEYERPPMLFDAIYRKARRDGLKVTSHCDVNQKDTHEHIRQVASQVTGSGLDRIDHGLNAAEVPELVELIKSNGLGMTLCPHAYHRRRSTEFVFSRIRTLYDAGIKITISSDDPTYFQNMWVSENLQLMRIHCQFSDDDMIQLQKNAIDICWASEDIKSRLRRDLDEYVKTQKN